MRKVAVSIIIIFSILLSSCSSFQEKDKYPDYYIECIDITISGDNPYGARSMAWPYYYKMTTQQIEMKNVDKKISVKDKNYLISYADSLTHEVQPDKECLCTISITLLDYGHGGKWVIGYIYDEYPKDFQEFVDTMNRLCANKIDK